MALIWLAANCDLDVTIYLVENSSMKTHEAGNTNKKRCRFGAQDSQSAQRATLGQVRVKANRLQQCSTYFDKCMKKKWVQSEVTHKEMEFHLEVHSEVQCYEDCFSRMTYLYKPIVSVACCIELLKVASQISFQALMDYGVKYLRVTTWSTEEEKLVREYFRFAHLVPSDSLTEFMRARLPSAQEAQQQKRSLNAKNLLSIFLREALPEKPPSESAALHKQNISRKRLAVALYVIMARVGSSDGVQEHIEALFTKALANLWTRLQKEVNDSPVRGSAVGDVLSDMCWLFEVARPAHVTQALVVELLGKDDDTVHRLHSASFKGNFPRSLTIWQLKNWASIIYALFEDLQEEKLFLRSSQRSTLFRQWGWLMHHTMLNFDREHVKAFRIRIVTTLPQTEQERFWRNTRTEPGSYKEAQNMWNSVTVTREVPLLEHLRASWNDIGSKTQE